MFKIYSFGLLVCLIVLDQVAPKLADQNLRENGTFEAAIHEFMPDLEGLNERSDRECRLQYVYAYYAYQICFQPYATGAGKSTDGYHLIYHRPKPKLSFVMPANNSDSFYFREMVQGEFMLFVQRDGEIHYGDAR